MSEIEMKTCRVCGVEKDETCFGIRKQKCKACVNEYKKGRHERRKQKFSSRTQEEKYPSQNRVCSTCHTEKIAEMFSKTCVGYSASCKICQNDRRREERWRGRIDTRHLPKSEFKSKICNCCKIEKLFEFFHKCLRGKFGLTAKCKDCRNQAAKQVQLSKKLEREEAKRLVPVIIQTHKICTNCGLDKDVEMFNFDKRSLKHERKCKNCVLKRRNDKREILKANAEALFRAQQANNTPIACKRCGVEKDVSLFEFNDKKPYPKCYEKCKECLMKYEIAKKERKIELLLSAQGVKAEHPTSKICNKCKIERDISLFLGHKLGQPYYRTDCQICKCEAGKVYRLENQEKILAKNRVYHAENREKINEKHRKFREENKERLSIQNKGYRIKGRARIAAWHRNKRKTDVKFKLLCNLRNRVYCALKGFSKSAKTLELLACSVEFLKSHLEAQFDPKMTWDNYGLFGWSVDHIIPCAAFDLEKEEEQRKCFHYSNLQPLWTTTEIAKANGSNKIGNINKSDDILEVDIWGVLL